MTIHRPRQDNGIVAPRVLERWADEDDPVVRWQRLIDAGLYGDTRPMSPESLEQIRRMEAIFRPRRPTRGFW